GYAFTGREWDSEASLYYYRARYYDPAIGRFLGGDTIGPPNLYSYVGNAPTNYTDPSGHEAVAAALAGAEIGSIAGPAGTIIGGLIGAGTGLYCGHMSWHEIAEPLFSKKTTKSNEDMNYDKFESEHK